MQQPEHRVASICYNETEGLFHGPRQTQKASDGACTRGKTNWLRPSCRGGEGADDQQSHIGKIREATSKSVTRRRPWPGRGVGVIGSQEGDGGWFRGFDEAPHERVLEEMPVRKSRGSVCRRGTQSHPTARHNDVGRIARDQG